MFFYPFDTQTCFISIQLAAIRKEVVSFSQEETEVEYLEKKVLPSFVVTKYKAEITDGGNNETRYSVLKVRHVRTFISFIAKISQVN